MSARVMTFSTLHASDLVRPPYERCPFCGTENTFGVLISVGGGGGYTRRCKRCWRSRHIELPPPKLKVLYLDQFVVSNIVKALDPATPAERRARLDPFWLTAFEKLHRLCKLHLIICPDSPVHYEESVVSDEFRKLKRIYEMLSAGVTFHEPDSVRNMQILTRAEKWIANEPCDWKFEAQSIARGKIDEWRGQLQIVLNSGATPGLVEDLRATRRKKTDAFAGVHTMWRDDKSLGFWDWFREERLALSKVVRQEVVRRCTRQFQVRSGECTPTLEDLLPNRNWRLFIDLRSLFSKAGYSEEEALRRIWEFLESEDLGQVPFVHISCLLFSVMAQLAQEGKKTPAKHPFNDTSFIAAYFPYCDAIFVDREMDNLLNKKPLPSELNYSTRLFSVRSKDAFLTYLDEIEANAPAAHLETVRSIYGEGWEKPYIEVFRHDK